MSLSSALTTAVSGLGAQSTALSNISKNIANSSTVAYKTTNTDFQTLLAGVDGVDTGGGVMAMSLTNLAQGGQISSTSTPTNLAIYGPGFFAVAPNATSTVSQISYTRDGSFTTDKSGYLVNNEGYYLEGFPTDATGKPTVPDTSALTNLQPINIDSIGGQAKATTQIKFSGNLPADATVGQSFTTTMSFFDSLGISHSVQQTWTFNGVDATTNNNKWTLALANPTLSSDASGTPTGDTVDPADSSITVEFDNNGVLASPAPPTTISIYGPGGVGSNLASGAAPLNISLNLGTPGKTDGATQDTSSGGVVGIGNPSFTNDGAVYGQLQGVSIDKAGLVTATFDNGVKLPVYQIPIATFPNPNGLTPVSGNIYSQNQAAGNVALELPGQGSAGTIEPESLEQSTTDIATEFNKMIVAQQAYSASSEIISTVKNMFQTLTQSVHG